MRVEFHETLSKLRKRKRVSQRVAAAEFGISQALLSHYENGIREPGLEFLHRACNYYGVTSDYLLGRSEENLAETISPTSAAVEAQLDARALVTLLQSVAALKSDALFHCTLRCFGAVTYTLLRHLATQDPEAGALFLSVPENRVAATATLEQHEAELGFLGALGLLPTSDEKEPRRLISPQLEVLLAALDRQIASHTKATT